MPEVSIPLNNNAKFGEQGVYDELSADNFLLDKVDACLFDDSMPSGLQDVEAISEGESENAVNPPHILVIVTVFSATILGFFPANVPSRGIEGFMAGSTDQNLTAPSQSDSAFTSLFTSPSGILPGVGTGERAKACAPSTARDKRLAAPVADIGATGIAPLLNIGVGSIGFSTSSTPLLLGTIAHVQIIPWILGAVKCD
jgi:hypothetical protein